MGTVTHKNRPSIIKQEPKKMPDLIDDGTWREAALARMGEVFPINRGLRPIYLLMASADRYAIDYIEQAPYSPPRAATHTSQGASAPLSDAATTIIVPAMAPWVFLCSIRAVSRQRSTQRAGRVLLLARRNHSTRSLR
jgi:hypothetical protein